MARITRRGSGCPSRPWGTSTWTGRLARVRADTKVSEGHQIRHIWGGVTCGEGTLWCRRCHGEMMSILGNDQTLLVITHSIAHRTFVQGKHSEWCLKYTSSDTDKYLSKKIVPTFLLVQSKKFWAWLHFCFLSPNIKKSGMSCAMISARSGWIPSVAHHLISSHSNPRIFSAFDRFSCLL